MFIKRNNKGITFIALIVTIIVLMIILSISLAILTGDNGIVKRTGEASESKNKSEEKEAVEWAAAQTVGDSEIGKVEQGRFKEFLDEYLGDGKDNGFDYEIEGDYTGIFVVEFKTSKNKYTIDDNGNVYEGEQTKRDGIEVDPSNVTINVGETIKLTYTTEADKDKIKWSSENEGIAKVDKDGNVTGISNGNVTIIVTTDKGKKSEAYITVQTEPSGIEVDPTESIIDLSSATRFVQITAKILPETANVSTGITWTSDNEDVATVTTSGLVTAKTNGEAIITATTENGISTTCKIIVQTSPTGINLSTTNATLDITDDPTMTLVAKVVPETTNVSSGITWTSSNPAIAEVSGEGENAVVTAKSNGEVEITATTENGKSMTCKVTVHTSPSKITISEANILLDLSDPSVAPNSKNLVITIEPETADLRNITWSSSKSSVATVTGTGKDNATGVVKGIANGTTTITATSVNGRTATCNVTVQTTPLSVSLNKTSATLDLSGTKTVQLTATINPITANVNTGLTWTSSNTSVATVSSNGLVTGISNGNATITVRTQNGKTATCNIIVETSITKISVSPTSATVENGKTLQLNATIEPSTRTEGVIWTSSNTSVATVSNSGLVTAKTSGTVTITVKSSSGKVSATSTITCKPHIVVSNTNKSYEIRSYVVTETYEDGETCQTDENCAYDTFTCNPITGEGCVRECWTSTSCYPNYSSRDVTYLGSGAISFTLNTNIPVSDLYLTTSGGSGRINVGSIRLSNSSSNKYSISISQKSISYDSMTITLKYKDGTTLYTWNVTSNY